ncbi:MAG TPA: histidine kinase [Flavisolibacter sp.]|jgi:sensor histidine kinase YesM|nr:histidine kinase [Flavisolibacter sp.]
MRLPIDKKRVRLYLSIGTAYLALWLLIDMLSNPDTFFKRAVNNTWLISYLVVLNFILYEYALPFIRLTWKRLLLGIFLIWALLMLYSFGFYAWRWVGIQSGIYFALRTHPSLEMGVEYHVPYSFMSLLFFGVIRYTYDYRKLKAMAQQLRIEKQEAELNYLKSQTNPHFLFNTLNNIYALARDKSDLAPESILRLSKILRFMLYETGSAYISIEQELKVMDDYIALERLRYDESLRVTFNHDIEEMRQALPPLLLIPLVENAFKHGAAETRGQPFVDIHLSVRQRKLTFQVKNSTEADAEEKRVTENIGLSNLRRQLELLYTDYSLSVQQEKTRFVATLHINLASHV